MKELVRLEDPVFLSWLIGRLAAASIEVQVFDGHTASAYAGVLDAVARRLMVDEADLPRARAILAEGERIMAQDATAKDEAPREGNGDG